MPTNPIAESLPYDSPIDDNNLQWQPAWHAVIHVLLHVAEIEV